MSDQDPTKHDYLGLNLKLARNLNGYTLIQVAENLDTSRQYIHQLESGSRIPTFDQLEKLASFLNVKNDFFYVMPSGILDDTSVHFRSNRTAKQSSRMQAKANIALFIRLLNLLSKYVNFPDLNFPSEDNYNSNLDIEIIAEKARKHWALGSGPIHNITQVVECSGAITTTFTGVSPDVDALSSVIKRPVIVRNDAKDSPGRLRFDIAHELGHIIMHQDIVTGCKKTELQANRFASAFLLPRNSFSKEFRIGNRMNWGMLSSLKKRWGVSKAALLYRARQLDLLNESSYTRHIINLKKNESRKENDDHLIPFEKSQLIPDAIKNYLVAYGKKIDDLCDELNVNLSLLNQILDFDVSSLKKYENDSKVTPILKLVD